jgi:ABC-type transport system involved in cytochrome bd biosynthesis fused ATPase/permease subunit
VGDGARGLSVGQCRRLALARAFVRDAPVVLLDEPTAGLDAATEARVLEGIRAHAPGRIVVLVTHRPPVLEAADVVYPMAQDPSLAEPLLVGALERVSGPGP